MLCSFRPLPPPPSPSSSFPQLTVPEDDEFDDFRKNVVELLRDVIFVVGSLHCFSEVGIPREGGRGGGVGGRRRSALHVESALHCHAAVCQELQTRHAVECL